MRSKTFYVVLFVVLMHSRGACQTVSYPTTQDVQAHMITLMADLRDSTKWGNLNQDFQDFFNTYLGWVQGGQVAEANRFQADEARIQTLEVQVPFLQKSISDAENDAANALSVAQTFADAFPCAILNLKVGPNDMGQRVVSFTTPTANCTGWAKWSVQTGLQLSRADFSPLGTVTPTFDATLKSGFTFAMPSTIPIHGTVQAVTYDQGGTKTVRQIEF